MKNYFVKLKNNDVITINEDQFNKLSKILLKDKTEIPSFIQINNDIIKTDFIANIKADTWTHGQDPFATCKKCGTKRLKNEIENGICIVNCEVKNETAAV
jgi:hypothetical protein